MKKILRYEHKYLIPLTRWHELRTKLNHLLVKDEHTDERAAYQVDTVYFDNEEGYYYQVKEAAISTRHLVRLRTYNHQRDAIRFEIKGKVGEGVYKWSIWLSTTEHQEILNGQYDCLLSKGSIGEQLYMNLVIHRARPRYLVRYEREVYLIPQLGVRISGDSRIQAQLSDDLYATHSIPIYPEEMVVMEIKGAKELPRYLNELIAMYHPLRVMNSKFERAIQQLGH